MKIANCKARSYVNQCIEFTGNNTFAKHIKNLYVVYSYGEHFPMFVYNYDTCMWYINTDRYSVTTSKHKSQLRPDCGKHYYDKDTSSLKELIKGKTND